MTPFEFFIMLLSVLFSIAIAHMLQSAGDLIRAGSRVRISRFHAAWMLASFATVLADRSGIRDLRRLEDRYRPSRRVAPRRLRMNGSAMGANIATTSRPTSLAEAPPRM